MNNTVDSYYCATQRRVLVEFLKATYEINKCVNNGYIILLKLHVRIYIPVSMKIAMCAL